MSPILYLIIILVCIILSGFFSASETALMRLRDDQLERDTQEMKGPAVFAARDLLKSTSRLLVTILIGNNVVNILAAACASGLAIFYLGPETGIIVSTTVMTVVILIFSEIIPKAAAAKNPAKISYLVALPLYILHKLFFPFHLFFDRIVDPFLQRVFKITEGDLLADTSEEILRLAKKAQQQKSGDGNNTESQTSPLSIITSTAAAADMTVSDIMVQRADIVGFPIDTPANDILNHLLKEGYTRVPIYTQSLDQIVGLIHLKDLINLNRAEKNDIREIMKPVIRVPEKKAILRLLADMQRAFVHMAIVKDEFGVTQGLVTSEDILEELVGEIRDEFDRDELSLINQIDDNTYEALGRITILDFNRESDWDLEDEKGNTLSGVVYNELGRSPHPGDHVRIGFYEIVVLDVSGSRITRVRVIRHAEDAGNTAQSG